MSHGDTNPPSGSYCSGLKWSLPALKAHLRHTRPDVDWSSVWTRVADVCAKAVLASEAGVAAALAASERRAGGAFVQGGRGNRGHPGSISSSLKHSQTRGSEGAQAGAPRGGGDSARDSMLSNASRRDAVTREGPKSVDPEDLSDGGVPKVLPTLDVHLDLPVGGCFQLFGLDVLLD